MKKVGVLMGSKNDFSIVEKTIEKLNYFNVPVKVLILSAHKSPNLAVEFAKNAEKNGFAVIIAAAGMAAHLAGIVAANTTLPVIGLPINCSLNGLDALLSTVQMPKGVPVLTVGINAAENAAIAACEILAISEKSIKENLKKLKVSLEEEIINQNKSLN